MSLGVVSVVKWVLVVGGGLASGLYAGGVAFHASPYGTRVASAAVFADDRRLESCVDVFGNASDRKVDVTDTSRIVGLRRSCEDEFSPRGPLAKCVIRGERTTSVDYTFDIRRIDSDAAMHDCLTQKGTWWQEPDVRVIATERLRHSMQDIDTLSESVRALTKGH